MIDIKIQTNDISGKNPEYRAYIYKENTYIDLCIAQSDDKEDLLKEVKETISELHSKAQQL